MALNIERISKQADKPAVLLGQACPEPNPVVELPSRHTVLARQTRPAIPCPG